MCVEAVRPQSSLVRVIITARINRPGRARVAHTASRAYHEERDRTPANGENTQEEKSKERRGGKKKEKEQTLDGTQAEGVRGGDKGREVNPRKPAQRNRCCGGQRG